MARERGVDPAAMTVADGEDLEAYLEALDVNQGDNPFPGRKLVPMEEFLTPPEEGGSG